MEPTPMPPPPPPPPSPMPPPPPPLPPEISVSEAKLLYLLEQPIGDPLPPPLPPYSLLQNWEKIPGPGINSLKMMPGCVIGVGEQFVLGDYTDGSPIPPTAPVYTVTKVIGVGLWKGYVILVDPPFPGEVPVGTKFTKK